MKQTQMQNSLLSKQESEARIKGGGLEIDCMKKFL